ncbi:MAG TPA: NADH-quinone oxidoreductase subunit M [Thermoanaerobaculaceae bacterium]|nr:NADH-quinone oxidoreductase subunit M [Thermoanaerobaculaceae bacterium]HRS17063.1 NADH-quinone oxidoreductase subunit M [Thermoanaerobaculaceae bacterium]
MTLSGTLLSALVLTPGTVGLLLLLLAPRDAKSLHRWAGMLASLVTLGLALLAWSRFDPADPAFQLVEARPWLPSLGISYRLGVDGVALVLVLLTALLQPVVMLSSWKQIDDKVKGYVASMLILETGMLGAFLATDLFLFYVFWELMLLPMYFIIGVWGGERRVYAAVKFVIFTLAGSLLMLVGILYLGSLHKASAPGTWSFAYEDIARLSIPGGEGFWHNPQLLAFAVFALAFAIKVPVWPLHTWLPDAHVEAPTGGSIILAGVLLKLGTFGFLRYCRPLFPEAWEAATPLFVTLAVIAIVVGALVAYAQKDLKKLVAYSSVSHMGFIMLGLFAGTVTSTQGALLQMVNHGLSTGSLFLLVGVIYDRRHTRLLEDFGGLARVMPLYTGAFLIATLSSIGLPGLNGFVGELLILLGSFRTQPVAVVIAATGIVLGAVYMLTVVQRVFWNPLVHEANRGLADLTWQEVTAFAPLGLAMFWIGVYPMPVLSISEAAIRRLIGG